MARWVRRMEAVDGHEERFNAYLKTLRPKPSEFRIRRLARTLHRHHIVIGRGMFAPLSDYDAFHYGQSVRRAMLANYEDAAPAGGSPRA